MDLRDVVGGTGDVVLDEVAPLEHGHLGGVLAHAHDHQVPAHRPALAVPTPTLLELFVVELEGIAPEDRFDRLDRCP